MANELVFDIWCKKCNSLSPTKLCSTLIVQTTRSYAQILCRMFYAVHLKVQCKSTGPKAAQKNGEIDVGE